MPVTFTGLADLFPQLGSSHEQLCGDFMYLALKVQCQDTYVFLMQGSYVQIQGVKFNFFFHDDIPGGLGSNLVL